MKRRLPLVVLLGAQLVVSAGGQQPTPTPTPATPPQTQQSQEGDDVVRITTNLVQVDAVVTDRNGKLVTDLKPEEVEIFENGRGQKITHFSFNTIANPGPPVAIANQASPEKGGAPIPPRRLKPEEVRRTIALVVDDLGLSFESTHFVRRALKKFVDEQMQPGDLVAIIRTAGGMGSLQQFTSDKRQLYAAIDRVKFYHGRGNVGTFAPITRPTEGERGEDIDAANEELNQFRDDLYSVGTLGAVTYVVRGLRDLPGRKSLLLISDGFRIHSRDDPNRSFRTVQRIQRLVDEAGRASVVIYTMNATGLQALGFTAEDDLSGRDSQQMAEALSSRRNTAFETQEGLEYLARETGGMAIKNTNDLSRGIRRVLEDQTGYYLIGYRPGESTFTARNGRRAFHHLSLKIKRAGKFNVRMRHGFFGVTDDEQAKPRTLAQQLIGALISPFGATGVRLQLTSLFANHDKAGSIMRSLLHIDARDLTFTGEADGMHKTQVDLLAIAFGENGVPIEQVARTYDLRLTGDQHQRAMRDGLVYYVTVPIKKSGAYQLRVSLRDSSSDRIGSASQFIEAPDINKKRLILSGVVVRGQDRASTQGAGAEGLEKGDAAISSAVRRFKPGMVMLYGFYIYNAKLDKASGRPQLITQVRLFRDGKEFFTGKETPFDPSSQTDLQRLAASGAIQLGTNMELGEYVIQIVVTDLLADRKHRVVTQWMDFQVVK